MALARYEPFVTKHFQVASVNGDEMTVLCPFHDDTHPSLSINVAKGVYVCWSCGESGTMARLAEAIGSGLIDLGVSTDQIRSRLVKNRPSRQVRYLPETALERYDFAHPFWTETRGFSESAVEGFRLGYDMETNRVTIPLRDEQGRLLGVSFRRLDDERPKYMDPPNFRKGKGFYGAWKLRYGQRKVALVEGPLDAVACWDARIPALAMMGGRLTRDQVRLLRILGITTVVTMCDNDAAGHKAVRLIQSMLHGQGIRVMVGSYRPYWRAKDPGELSSDRRRKMYFSAERANYLQSRR